MSTSTSIPLEVGVGHMSGSRVGGLEPARGQEPIMEVMKIQKVKEIAIGR